MYNKWITRMAVACFFSLFCLMPSMAEDQTNAAVAYSDADLKSFIYANAGLYQVQQQVMAQMKGELSDEQRQEIMETGNQQMLQVLQQVGLTPESYNAMGQSIQSDTQLQAKLRTMATELAQQESPQ